MQFFVLRVASNKEDQVREKLARKVKIEGLETIGGEWHSFENENNPSSCVDEIKVEIRPFDGRMQPNEQTNPNRPGLKDR